MSTVLTVDIGTTSAKALVVNHKGEILASAQEFYPTIFPQPGFAVQDTTVLSDGILGIIKKAAGQSKSPVDAIAFSSAMHSLMAIDVHKRPLTPLILWSDMRSTQQAKQLQNTDLGNEIYRITGTPIHPMSPLCKLMWMREHEPGLIQKTWKFISIKEYILMLLCGDLSVDHSVASSSGMFDVHQLTWSELALDLAGIKSQSLSPCVDAYDDSLKLLPAMASKLGIPANVRIVPGGSDGCLAHFGSHAMNKGQLSMTIGTSGAVRMASKNFSVDPKRRIFNYRLDKENFIAGGATNNGSVLLSWFCNNFYKDKATDLVGFAQEAHTVGSGADGLLFLPYVFGERAPLYNPDLRGVFFGLAQHHTKAHMMRALLEGICFEIRSIVDSVEESIQPVTDVFASGGFVRSHLWLQLMADVLQKRITLRDVNDASSMGAALMGFRSLGHEVNLDNSADDRTFDPSPGKADIYNDLYGAFSRLTGSLRDEFSTIVALQNRKV